ncbi:MAG: SDR family NAD(P)-dependent oxidoreductase, partial [Candidatus Dormibacteria bacterium]
VLALNLVAPLALIQLVVPAMSRRGGGAVVNVSSATSNLVIPGLGAYAATKAALDRISLVAQRELAPLGIRVSLVHPGVTATEFHQSLRAGEFRGRPNGPPPDPPELVAAAIAEAIRSGSGDLEAGGPSR